MARLSKREVEQLKRAVVHRVRPSRYPVRAPADYVKFATFAARFGAGQPVLKAKFITQGEHWKL
jgi:hypothetical protein